MKKLTIGKKEYHDMIDIAHQIWHDKRECTPMLVHLKALEILLMRHDIEVTFKVTEVLESKLKRAK